MSCDYCTEDRDGYVRAMSKRGHVYVHDSPDPILRIRWYGKDMDVKIRYCPMCGRKLGSEEEPESAIPESVKDFIHRRFMTRQ